MFTTEEKKKLKTINELFNQLEDIYLSFDEETKEKITEYHNETGSVPHCIRWGIQGTEELIREKTLNSK